MDYTIFFDAIAAAIGARDGLSVVRPENLDGNADYHVSNSWKLNNDSDRPNKRSKSLVITISQEALENYRDAPENSQIRAIEKLEEIVKARLNDFNPEHDAPWG